MSISNPFAVLHELGQPKNPLIWPDYLALAAFDTSHIPQLIELATNRAAITAAPDTQAYWTAAHAWRTLAQLRAEEAIEPLLAIFPFMDTVDNDRATSDIPTVLAQIGPASLTHIAAFLADAQHGDWPRIHITCTLAEMPGYHPATKARCVEIAATQLASFSQQDRIYNGYLVKVLIAHSAVEHIDVLHQVFRTNSIELSRHEEWQEIRRKVALLEEHLTQHQRRAETISRRRQIDSNGGAFGQMPRVV